MAQVNLAEKNSKASKAQIHYSISRAKDSKSITFIVKRECVQTFNNVFEQLNLSGSWALFQENPDIKGSGYLQTELVYSSVDDKTITRELVQIEAYLKQAGLNKMS